MKSLRIITAAILSAVVLSSCEKKETDEISKDKVNVGAQMVQGKDGKSFEAVDLGLSVLWATCNIGANSSENTGSYFAWGETEPKTHFEWANYKWCEEDKFTITKYCFSKNNGAHEFVDKIASLEKSDDAARVQMGENWRIPTKKEFAELLYFCDAKWGKVNGVSGFLLTSKEKGYEGNSIFLPLSGKYDMDQTKFQGKYGWYWSSDLNDKSTVESNVLWIEHDEYDNLVTQFCDRSIGLPIRAVSPKF